MLATPSQFSHASPSAWITYRKALVLKANAGLSNCQLCADLSSNLVLNRKLLTSTNQSRSVIVTDHITTMLFLILSLVLYVSTTARVAKVFYRLFA